MTNIILVRHGETEWNGRVCRFRGRADIELSNVGVEQAHAAARRIASGWHPRSIISSPLRRCRATAEIIARPWGLRVEPQEALNDLDYGEWQGLTLKEVGMRWPRELQTWLEQPHLVSIPGGESLETLLARVSGFVDGLVRDRPKETVVLVGHNTVNRVVLLHALGLPLSRFSSVRQGHCAVSEIVADARGFTVRAMNERCHLPRQRRARNPGLRLEEAGR